MKADEFLRRWEGMPNLKKVELINGVVHMPPMLSEEHGDQDNLFGTWIGIYSLSTPGTRSSTNRSYQLNDDNAPQPDQSLRILPKLSENLGVPELVLETALSSLKFDLGDKLKLYEEAGVQEYIVADIARDKLHWFRLQEGKFQPLEPGEDGIYRSVVFPGLWLDAVAVFQYDRKRFQEVTHAGLASPEHATFIEKLQQADKE